MSFISCNHASHLVWLGQHLNILCRAECYIGDFVARSSIGRSAYQSQLQPELPVSLPFTLSQTDWSIGATMPPAPPTPETLIGGYFVIVWLSFM